jgi:oxygen-dependent protoporphyrinogen oxidase
MVHDGGVLSSERPTQPHIVVIGGGISGLAAALRLHDAGGDGITVTVLEQSATVGGKLRTGLVAGVQAEDGADSFLLRTPEARALVERVGLGPELVSPTSTGAAVRVGTDLRPLPSGTLMGIPADLEAVAASGVLGQEGLARVWGEAARAGRAVTGDVAVGALVAERLGPEVLDRLVEPLLGGVYAGRADRLSLQATMPALATGLAAQPSLVRAAQLARGTATGGGPVFGTVRGGMSRLVTTVVQASGAVIRTGATVRGLRPVPGGWKILVGPTRSETEIHADAVVLAVPAAPAARLLTGVETGAAATVGELEYASVALVTLVLPGRLALPPGTGALIPASSGKIVKAVTYVSQKWGHLVEDRGAAPVTVLRASVGRFGEESALQTDDRGLVAAVLAELGEVLPVRLPAPAGVRVSRWGGALPQYAPGHLDRVLTSRAALADYPTLAVAGAAYDGVGIPACIRSGYAAADQVLAGLSLGALGKVGRTSGRTREPLLTRGGPSDG